MAAEYSIRLYIGMEGVIGIYVAIHGLAASEHYTIRVSTLNAPCHLDGENNITYNTYMEHIKGTKQHKTSGWGILYKSM